MIQSQNALLKALGIKSPIIQAPMAGGATTPELVSNVSNTGALGSFAAALLSPDVITQQINEIRAKTDAPFSVNLFILSNPTPDQETVDSANKQLAPFLDELGISPSENLHRFCEDNQAQIDQLIELAPPVVSFAFDLLDSDTVAEFKRRGCFVIGTATNTKEALAWQAVGADAICAQGSEAGGHRGTFIGDFEQSNLGLFALIPQLVKHLDIPVIAAGGIMTGQGINAALALGASACQLGTAFLTCKESGIHPLYKQRLLQAEDTDTRLTRVFSGKYARGIVNEFMQQLRKDEATIVEYPVQNALTGQIRKVAAQQNNIELMSLWAGQGASLCRSLDAKSLIETLVLEMNQ